MGSKENLEREDSMNKKIDLVFKVMMIIGIIMALSSIPFWLITKYPATSFVLLIIGSTLAVGSKLDWETYKRNAKNHNET